MYKPGLISDPTYVLARSHSHYSPCLSIASTLEAIRINKQSDKNLTRKSLKIQDYCLRMRNKKKRSFICHKIYKIDKNKILLKIKQ